MHLQVLLKFIFIKLISLSYIMFKHAIYNSHFTFIIYKLFYKFKIDAISNIYFKFAVMLI